MNRRRIWTIVLVVALAGAGFLAYRQFGPNPAAAAADLQTVQVERGNLEATINAAGTMSSPQSASLAWQTSGLVRAVFVEVGDSVAAGDVLMELEPASLDPSVTQASSDLADAQRALDDLMHSNLARAQAQLTLANAQDAVRVAQYNYNVQQEGHRATAETIDVARANLLISKNKLGEVEDAYQSMSGLPRDDPARALALQRLASARASYNSTLATYNWYTGHPTDIEQAKLAANLAIAQAQLEDAEREYERLVDGPDPLDVAAAEARVAGAQATADRVRIVAPFDGTIVRVSGRPGDLVESGTTAVALADLRTLEVQVDVSEVDINSIQVGQEASLTLDAAPDQTFRGVVSQISLSGAVAQGVVTFPVTVQIADPGPSLKPGMSSAVSIVIERHENVLLVPNRALRLVGGQRSVVVLFEGQQVSVPVTLGLSNETNSEVLAGALQAGDAVVLNATTSAQTGFAGGGGFIGGGGFRP